jgi:hypothetical protein
MVCWVSNLSGWFAAAVLGAVLHFLIALGVATVYFAVSRRLKFPTGCRFAACSRG